VERINISPTPFSELAEGKDTTATLHLKSSTGVEATTPYTLHIVEHNISPTPFSELSEGKDTTAITHLKSST